MINVIRNKIFEKSCLPKTRMLPSVLLAPLLCLTPQLGLTAPFLLNEYNLITLYNGTVGSGDLNAVGEIEGRAFIGGDFLATSQTNVGFKYTSSTDVQLQVAGVVGGPSDPGSNILVKGSTEIDEAFTASSSTEWTVDDVDSGRVIKTDGAAGSDLSAPGNLDALALGYTAELQFNSADFGALPDTASWSYENENSISTTSIIFDTGDLTAGEQAVFSIDASDISGLAQQGFKLIGDFLNLVDEIIINVTNLMNINLSFAQTQNFNEGFANEAIRQKTLWNFLGEDWGSSNTISHSTNFRGSVLAPYADWDAGNQNVDGSIAVRSFESTAEIHVANLSVVNDGSTGGNTTVQAPESEDEGTIPLPGTFSLLLAGLLCLLARRRGASANTALTA